MALSLRKVPQALILTGTTPTSRIIIDEKWAGLVSNIHVVGMEHSGDVFKLSDGQGNRMFHVVAGWNCFSSYYSQINLRFNGLVVEKMDSGAIYLYTKARVKFKAGEGLIIES